MSIRAGYDTGHGWLLKFRLPESQKFHGKEQKDSEFTIKRLGLNGSFSPGFLVEEPRVVFRGMMAIGGMEDEWLNTFFSSVNHEICLLSRQDC